MLSAVRWSVVVNYVRSLSCKSPQVVRLCRPDFMFSPPRRGRPYVGCWRQSKVATAT